MIAVADQIEAESGIDVLDSDVLVLGHHGSFTSSSLGFMLRVDPNVGIISADDKSYAGSTLPDFSALFWNMNSHHPQARSILHSIFFHADMLALKRGEPVDGYAWRNRYSQSAARVFRRRRRWPVPMWRTDFNDDLENVNTLMDNILIETDDSRLKLSATNLEMGINCWVGARVDEHGAVTVPARWWNPGSRTSGTSV